MKTNDLILVQEADFDINQHYQKLLHINPAGTGAAVLFVGLVRDLDDARVEAMELEHYPGMTENCLQTIVKKAHDRWSIEGIHVIHRVGKLQSHEQIVLVGVASRHRTDAFSACEFVMDYLKQDAPFWKAEITQNGKTWVDAKESDKQATKRWQGD
ncbi:MAG: molybdenum cofactor biosynthesis protein MoaE [Oceanospirillaceae bacterium]|nr:molybdenum cofactor biosynthesis protein MoaE [Oceanospirillaceae bacterium]